MIEMTDQTLLSLVTNVGTMIWLMFALDRAYRLLLALIVVRKPEVDIFGPKSIMIQGSSLVQSAGDPTTRQQEGCTG
jgi:hypothetical protein